MERRSTWVAYSAREHISGVDSASSRSRASMRAALAALLSVLVVSLVVYAIFRVYSDELSDEFYQMAIESMDDYTTAQKAEVESSLSDIGSAVSTIRVLAESPDIDPEGPVFVDYLKNWNEQGSYQVTYASIEELEEIAGSASSSQQDADALRRIKEGESLVSDVRKSNRLNGYYFSIAEPVVRDGKTVGVVRSIVQAERLIATNQLRTQVSVLGSLLIKSDGTIVAVSNESSLYDGKNMYEILEQSGVSTDQVAAIRASVDNERDVSTLTLGKNDGLMSFITSVRLSMNDWTIVNFTQESTLADRSANILSSTIFTATLLVAISAVACLIVAIVVGRFRRRARRSAERYAVLAEFSDTVLFEYSYQRDTLDLTPNAREVFPLSALTLGDYVKNSKPLIEFYEGDYPKLLDLLENPAPPDQQRSVICRVRVLTGEFRWFSFTCRYLYEGSQPYMAVGKVVDITRQHEVEELLTRKSQTDGLTKALNKVTVEEVVGTLLSEIDEGMLFVLDMDRFKHVNDQYGHSMGDRVLEETARILFDVFRRSDPVGRIGGDEFVVFVPGTGDEGAANAKREALKSSIAEASRIVGVPIGMSIGVARYPQDGTTYQELFDAADKAMYEAKNEGRSASR